MARLGGCLGLGRLGGARLGVGGRVMGWGMGETKQAECSVQAASLRKEHVRDPVFTHERINFNLIIKQLWDSGPFTLPNSHHQPFRREPVLTAFS